MRRLAWAGGVLAMAFLGALGVAVVGTEVGAAGLVVGVALAILPVPFYVALCLWLDRYEKEPLGMLALGFFWGATVAFFFALVFNSINGALFHQVAGATAASLATPVVSAPFVEELAKGAALFLLFFLKRDEFDNVTDGVVYAAMVGLGFAMSENVLYYGRALGEGAAAPVGTFFVRGVLAPFAHPLYTAMTGIGLGLARESRGGAVRWLAPLAGLAAAMLLHALWNLAASLGGGAFLLAYFILMVPVFAGVLVVVVWSLRREAAVLRAQLGRYAERSGLTPREIRTLASIRGRAGTSAAALRNGGLGGWRRRRAFHQAASDLAFHAWRTSRGISRGPERDAAREAAHLARLRALRAEMAGGGTAGVERPPRPPRSERPPKVGP